MHIERTGQRERDEAQMDALFSEGFPAFITADASVKPVIGRVREYFADLDIILLDGDPGVPIATGWGVPVVWGGDPATLPPTFGDLLRRAVEGHEDGVPADTFALCGAVVHPGHKGTGVASALVEALVGLGAANGLSRVVAPLRPTLSTGTRSPPSSSTPPGSARTVCRSTRGCGCTTGSADGSSERPRPRRR